MLHPGCGASHFVVVPGKSSWDPKAHAKGAVKGEYSPVEPLIAILYLCLAFLNDRDPRPVQRPLLKLVEARLMEMFVRKGETRFFFALRSFGDQFGRDRAP